MKRFATALVLVLFLVSTAAAKPPSRAMDPDPDPIYRRVIRVIKFIVQPLTDPIIPPRP